VHKLIQGGGMSDNGANISLTDCWLLWQLRHNTENSLLNSLIAGNLPRRRVSLLTASSAI
jgi:hypothetical protein